MTAPFNLAKFRKGVDKSIPGMSHGFYDPTTWLDTGCLALNYLISNRFDGGVPLEGKFTMFAGDSGSGKSYIAAANLIKDAQKKNVFPILIDTENAGDASWMQSLGVNTDEDALIKLRGSTVDDIAKSLGMIFDDYKASNASTPYHERPKVLIVIDSIGMMITPNNERQFNEGDQKGDMGIKAKQVTNLSRVMLSKIGNQPIGMVATNHVYDSQDQYKPDQISGGKMLEFSTSVIVQMNKHLLKEDEHGNKLTDGQVAGIKSTCVVRKSRYAKPFEKIFVRIPYDKGMDPYSGLFDLFEKKGLLLKEGNRYTYTSRETGEVFTEFRKKYKTAGILDTIVSEQLLWDNDEVKLGVDNTGATEDSDDDE